MGDLQNRTQPTAVDLSEVSWVSCGFGLTLFLKQNGEAYGTGFASNGRIGVAVHEIEDHTPDGHPYVTSPTRAFSGSNVRFKRVALGSGHGIGLTFENEVYTWGRNDLGQTGIESRQKEIQSDFSLSVPSEPFSDRPQLVSRQAVQVFAIAYTSAFQTVDGRVYMFGSQNQSPIPKLVRDDPLTMIVIEDIFYGILKKADSAEYLEIVQIRQSSDILRVALENRTAEEIVNRLICAALPRCNNPTTVNGLRIPVALANTLERILFGCQGSRHGFAFCLSKDLSSKKSYDH